MLPAFIILAAVFLTALACAFILARRDPPDDPDNQGSDERPSPTFRDTDIIPKTLHDEGFSR
jgi:hypothetical protein